jgi:hypothetical protein
MKPKRKDEKMVVGQDIHNVIGVRAVRMMPHNSNCVTIKIDAADGCIRQTLYFGDTPEDRSKALAFFFALGGLENQIAGKETENA